MKWTFAECGKGIVSLVDVDLTTYKKMNNGLELKSKNGKKIKITFS